MSQCVYCLRDQSQTTFNHVEHVIPRALGSFEPLNPTIKGDLICDICNNDTFSPLETNFIEDSWEGVHGQRLNLENRKSVTIRNKNFKIEQLHGFGDKFFDEMFFFLKSENRKIVVDIKNQIKLRRLREGYRVFRPEALETLNPESSKFKKIAQDMKKLSQKNIAIFAETEQEIEEIIKLLKTFGVDYKEKKNGRRFLSPENRLVLDEEYSCSVDSDIARVLAKIAFNYFIYCAKQSQRSEILLSSEFNLIRNFITKGIGKLKDFIVSIHEEPILREEKDSGIRLVAHLINFLPEHGKVVVRMTFFGLPAIYKIVLGEIPNGCDSDAFGCGHAFNPFTHKIYNLSQSPSDDLTEDQIRATFGLFKRVLEQ